LHAADAEIARRGRLSPATSDALRAVLGFQPAEEPPRSGRHDGRLATRDAVLRELANFADGRPWRKAATAAGWLRRHALGDPLLDAPAPVADLCQQIGAALSQRQVYRVLTRGRSD
jgi:hypothetical protein